MAPFPNVNKSIKNAVFTTHTHPSFEPGDVIPPVVTVGRVEGVVVQLGKADNDLVDLLPGQQNRSEQ